MPDYIYLLENRLSHDQRHALAQLREAAREAGTILFLTGDAVRELTSGHAVRSLEVAIHGNALKLKKSIEALGGKVWGEHEPTQSLYLCFPGTVRVDLLSTHSVSYPKPGKPVYQPASIQEDLRRRDFTVNAMAISLNEGSFGLLMDPLNGAADIETRTLRLVSNYGFIEDPSLMIRATRYRARLGWEMDVRTQNRYEDAKAEGMMEVITPHALSQELEQIGHEEEALTVLRALETEGWMQTLFPAWTSAKADEERLKALHELTMDLLVQGVHADMSAAQMQLLTAKLAPKDLTALKKTLLRPGFVEEWDNLDAMAAAFQKVLLSKDHAQPSATYKLFTSYDPEAVLWLGFTSKNATVQERYTQFLKTWPEVRQQIPYAQMLEMRITPELANYNEIVQNIFLELIDGKLATPEEMKAYLDPFSPPPPPPKETIKRSRPRRSAEAKAKEQSFDDDEDSETTIGDDEDLDDLGGDDEIEIDLKLGDDDLDTDDDQAEADEAPEAEDEPPAKPAKGHKAAEPKKAAKATPVAKPAKEKPAPKPAPEPKTKTPPAAKTKSAPAPAKATPAHKPAAKTAAKPAPKPVAKPAAKAAAKPAPASKAKAVAKPVAAAKKAAPVKAKAKPAPAKPAAKKPAAKSAKKR